MNAIGAIYKKQWNDFPKNLSVSLLFVMFPVLAFIMGSIQGYLEMQAAVFAASFVGTTPMVAICMTVAEDREYKGLRFLVMAGVKPTQYLIGLTGFVLMMSLLPLSAFIFMGGFTGTHLVFFVALSVLALIASCLLGAGIGIFAKHVQQATAIYTPIMMALMLAPMFASANETLERVAEYLFSFQILIVALYPGYDMVRALVIISANIVVLLGFFIFAYKRKGLRG